MIMMTATLSLVILSSMCSAWNSPQQGPPATGNSKTPKTSFAEARFGYLWGINEIKLRDGDNALIPPSKREFELQGILYGIAAGTFFTDDLGVRVQAWIDVPQQIRNNFYLDRTVRSWDTRPRYIAADLAAIYSIGPRGLPLTAGLMAGYRYTDLDYDSRTVSQPAGTFHDHFQIHIPYLGVYYANTAMAGSVARLDVVFSPIALCRLDSDEHRSDVVTEIQGHSVTGRYFETFFSWSWPVSGSTLVGIFADYTYLDLSGGATVVQGGRASTRFSLDAPFNIVLTGVSLSYAF